MFREEGLTRFEDHAGREEANREDDALDEEGPLVAGDRNVQWEAAS